MSDREPVIRDARPDEWAEVADLHARSWRSAYRGMMTDAYLDGPVGGERSALWRERFAAPAHPDRIVVVAEEGSRLVGLACILAGNDPAWGSLIDNLHVDPERKRRGVGRLVLAAALRRLTPGRFREPIHLTVLEANTAAQQAYERWGGRLAEHLVVREPDGEDHAVRRYAWPSGEALLDRLRPADATG